MHKKKVWRRVIKGFVILLIVLTGTELFLRFYLGLGHMILFREDKDFEYIPLADQNFYRWRNHIYYNHYSMRSDELNPKAIKILGFGDSIINGGAPTDNDSLATSILSKELSQYLDTAVQMLNISAPSWGASNCFAYLKKYGDFNAKTIVLFVSSEDAYDNMNFIKTVGDDYHPDKNYPLALFEAWHKYGPILLSYFTEPENPPQPEFRTPGTQFDPGFQNFYEYCKEKNIKFIICMHPAMLERNAHKYLPEGEEIIQFVEKHNITFINEMNYPFTRDDYRGDKMHYSESGQRKLAQILLPYLKAELTKK